MLKKITGKRIAINLILSLTAQAISIITSFVLGFIVPKFIDEYQYSYWQIYVLYAGYTGVLQFGLLDGIVLRYSQYDYSEIDKPRLRSQFQLLLSFTSALTIIGITVAAFMNGNITSHIVALVAISITIKNIFGYTSYSFQITNRIKKYVALIITQRATYALIVVILLLCRVNNFYWFCVADICGDATSIILGAIFNRGMYFGRALPIKETFREAWSNLSAGIMLMLANFSANFIAGGAKMIVQWRWDELLFGQVSFSFSVSNLFLTFVTAISVVLFPSLKRMDPEELPDMYTKIRNTISPIMFFAIIFYFPGCWILEHWLTSYTDSLIYLGILLPLIIFSAKVNLLTNNYLKAYRKEGLMLVINISAVVLGLVLSLIGAYVLSNIYFVLYSLVIVILLYSVASEIAVSLIIKKRFILDFILELILTAVFVLSVRYLPRWWACLSYGIALLIYLIIYHKSIAAVFRTLLSIFKKKEQ